MSKRFSREQLQDLACVSDSPLLPGQGARGADLPRGLYVAAAIAYLAVIGFTATLFVEAGLALSMMILANLVVLAFGLAGHWAGPRQSGRAALMAGGHSPRMVSIL